MEGRRESLGFEEDIISFESNGGEEAVIRVRVNRRRGGTHLGLSQMERNRDS